MTHAANAAAAAIVTISITRNVSGSPSPANQESRQTAGVTNTATCIDEVIAISVARVVLPRCAITTAPPCSAALPTIATITAEMKNSFSPTASPKLSSECTSTSETSAVATVDTASTVIDLDSDHALLDA